MVNTEHVSPTDARLDNYNILNIVVNTELIFCNTLKPSYYNILNIVVNTEHKLIGVFYG